MIWMSEGPDIGQPTRSRPAISADLRSLNTVYRIDPPAPTGKAAEVGGAYWSYSDAWQEDIARWDWAQGIFVVSHAVMLSEGSSGDEARAKLGYDRTRLVISGVRLSRDDIERIVPSHTAQPIAELTSRHPTDGKPSSRGRKRKREWDDWSAEVIILIQLEGGVDLGLKGEDFHDLVAERLKRRKLQSPDFNPIEKAFSRLKAMLRKAGERTVSGLWDLIGRLVDMFQPAECANYFKSCGYEPE